MRLFYELRNRIRFIFGFSAKQDELDEEISFHLQEAIDERIESGIAPKEARLQAIREFGGMNRFTEECRDAWGTRVITNLIRDVRLSLRSLLKARGFTTVAVLTLALAIGANTSVFSVANSIMLKSLPVDNPEELRWLTWSGELQNFSRTGWASRNADGLFSTAFAYPTLEQFQQEVEGAEVFGLFRIREKTLRASGNAFTADGYFVSDNFFQGLGVSASLGRVFEGASGDALSAVISHGLWQREFGGAADMIGQSLTIEGSVFSVSGVLPPEFRGPIRGYRGEFYVPFVAVPQVMYFPRLYDDWSFWVEIMLRLTDEGSESRAVSSLQSIMTRATPEKFIKDPDRPVRVVLHDGKAGLTYGSKPLGGPLRPLLAVAAIVLLIACVNLAGLMLARGASREHQAAVEGALGASRWRLMRRPILESLLIALGGGALGLVLAFVGKSVLAKLLWPGGLPVDFSNDYSVFVFTILITALTALLFGLLPAWRLSKDNSIDSLRARSAQGLPRLKIGRALVSVQVGLSLVLLVGGGLFARSLYELSQVETGFADESLLAFPANASSAGHQGSRRIAYYEDAQTMLERIPGISAVSFD